MTPNGAATTDTAAGEFPLGVCSECGRVTEPEADVCRRDRCQKVASARWLERYVPPAAIRMCDHAAGWCAIWGQLPPAPAADDCSCSCHGFGLVVAAGCSCCAPAAESAPAADAYTRCSAVVEVWTGSREQCLGRAVTGGQCAAHAEGP